MVASLNLADISAALTSAREMAHAGAPEEAPINPHIEAGVRLAGVALAAMARQRNPDIALSVLLASFGAKL